MANRTLSQGRNMDDLLMKDGLPRYTYRRIVGDTIVIWHTDGEVTSIRLSEIKDFYKNTTGFIPKVYSNQRGKDG